MVIIAQIAKTILVGGRVKMSYGYNEDRSMFRNPGGRSALRAGKRVYPCPTCGRENQLTIQDKKLGYQCDRCADRAEGNLMGEY